jgi:hypothetical protein
MWVWTAFDADGELTVSHTVGLRDLGHATE